MTYLTNSRNNSRITSDTDLPFSAARSVARCHKSSSIRTPRILVPFDMSGSPRRDAKHGVIGDGNEFVDAALLALDSGGGLLADDSRQGQRLPDGGGVLGAGLAVTGEGDGVHDSLLGYRCMNTVTHCMNTTQEGAAA